MTLLPTIAAAAAGVAALLFVVGALLPADWTVERSTTIAAPPEAVYPLVAGFKGGWSQWNPWLEPNMKVSFSGPETGVGATQSWTGGDTNGGTITITSADAPRHIEFSLNFGPFPIQGTIELTPTPAGATLQWRDSGRIAGLPIYRFMRFGLNRFVGQPMERGLATLKQLAKSGVPTR